jgi:hypothetical protein
MKNYTVVIEYSSGIKIPLSTDNYNQASHWWDTFANQDAANSCDIVIVTMFDNKNKKTIASFCAKGMANKVA